MNSYFNKIGLKKSKTSVYALLFTLGIAIMKTPLFIFVKSIKLSLLPIMYIDSLSGVLGVVFYPESNKRE